MEFTVKPLEKQMLCIALPGFTLLDALRMISQVVQWLKMLLK